jgi:DNA-binding NarL/FixJ family response regulator
MRVILADDHSVVRGGLRWALEHEDDIEIVGEAGDGQALLDLLDGLDADIVLLDIRMPGLGGLDVLPRLTAEHPELGVVILSMHDEPAFIRAAIERGASGYLLKSAGIEELVAALRVVASGKSYIQSSLTHHVFAEVADPGSEQPSERGLEILRLVADGLATAEIAAELGVSESAVKASLQQTFDRLGVSSRAEAVALALRRGLID